MRELIVVDGVIDDGSGRQPTAFCVGKPLVRPCVALFEEILRPAAEGLEGLSLTEKERIEWEYAAARAMELISHHPPSAKLVTEFGWLLVPIRNNRDGYHLSISFNSVPNAIFASFHRDAESLAETLVHESDHNWFFLVSRYEEFWKKPAHLQPEIYRSPWRDDPRPLDGILRGASAFVRVSAMWAGLLAALPKTHPSLGWIRKRVFLRSVQAVDALRTLMSTDELSMFGRRQVTAWSKTASETHRAIMGESSTQECLLAAFDEQSRHDREWALRNSGCTADAPMSLDDYFSFVR